MTRFNKDIIKIESLASTNDFAKELLSQKIPLADITSIEASEQTKGRGQKGNYWESESGKNLTISLIVKPLTIKPEQQFYLSMAVSLAIESCLSHFVDNVFIKWPNDIYINNKKICGILIENTLLNQSITTAIIGIGLNVNQTIFSGSIPNPTSLRKEKDMAFDLEDIKTQLFARFDHYYGMLIDGLFSEIHQEYLNYLYLKERTSLFKDAKGVFEGIIKTVNSRGLIEIVKRDTETKQYAFKEVQYILQTIV
jgi:BirA family biotin operon repressor/biotin-[acetyl-CoA-carboxylase] ligase